jgi:hypothetical protein
MTYSKSNGCQRTSRDVKVGGTYHGGEHTLQDGAEDIEDIAEEPNNDELDREGIGGASLEILYDLRRENDHCEKSATLVRQEPDW